MNRRPLQCGAVRVVFMARKRIRDVPVQPFNTPRGAVLVSTPEATGPRARRRPGAGGVEPGPA
jgi:AbiEi antitoxin C-terminal domain